MSTEISVSPLDLTTCRILTVSSSLDRALSTIDRIKLLAKSTDDSIEVSESDGSNSLKRIPWTISNKYYSADVHFAARSIKGLAPYQVQNVPAVLFVWANGEEYRSHIQRLSQDLNGYDPEVMLAVRVQPDTPISPEDLCEEKEEDSEIDEFLSSQGFEFVDAIDESPVSPTDDEDNGFAEGIPALPRVIDALSTIMWPNMKQPAKSAGGRRQGVEALLDLTQSSRDNSLSAIESLVSSPSDDSTHRSRRKLEMAALERWLEEDVRDRREDPWKFKPEPDAFIQSPTDIHNDATPGSEGFDDDFSVFVFAPPREEFEEDGPQRAFTSSFLPGDASDLKPAPAGELYHSLGSTSDLGDMDHPSPTKSKEDEGSGDDESSDGLPTEEEIHEASKRLFGPDFLPSTSKKDDAAAKSIFDEPFDSLDGEFDFGNSDYEMAPFDLNHVMSALQVMKAEISHMENEDERRKAAASVALSLVYGLEGQPP